MKTKAIFTICLTTLNIGLWTFNSSAQSPNWQWAKSAGGAAHDMAASVATDANGNSFVAGYFRSPTITFGSITLTNTGFYDIFIVKYDVSGNVLWAKSAGGSYYDMAASVATDANGNCYVTGYFGSPTITFGSITLTHDTTGYNYDMFLVKYDNSGNELWVKSAIGSDTDNATSVTTDANGNSYVAGYSWSPSITFGSTTLTNTLGFGEMMFVVKYDSSGNALWAKSAGGTQEAHAYSVATNANGNIYVAGYFGSTTIIFGSTTLTNADPSGNTYDMFIAKYDSSGNVLWAKSAGKNNNYDYARSVATDANGNCYVAGAFTSPIITFGSITLTNADNFDNSSHDFFLVKYDSTGNVLWAKNTGIPNVSLGVGNEEAYSVATDANGNSYVAGFFSSSIIFGADTLTNSSYATMFIAKHDSNGNALWAKKAGGIGEAYATSVATDANGNSYVTGSFMRNITFGSTTLSSATDTTYDIFITKLGILTTGIESLENREDIAVYPNPTTGKVAVSSIGGNITSIEIYNVLGEKVGLPSSSSTGKGGFNSPPNNPGQEGAIDISYHPSGIYFLKIIHTKGVIIKKIIKE